MNVLRGVAVLAATGVLAACGGGGKLGGGKEGAAQALFQTTSALSSARKSSTGGLRSGADLNATVTVPGRHGGTAKVEMKLTSIPFAGTVDSTITYDKFNVDGKNTFDGTLTTSLATEGSAAGASATLKIKGKVTVAGDVNDFLDADVTQKLTVDVLNSTHGKVSLSLDGSIATSSESFTYQNETLSIDVDATLPSAPKP